MTEHLSFAVYGRRPAVPAFDDYPALPAQEYVVAYCGRDREAAVAQAQYELRRHPNYEVWILASARGVRDILNTQGEKIGELED